MEKIKSVLSHGSRKSTDAAHQDRSPPIGATQPTSPTDGNREENHPIYDQMTGNGHVPPAASSNGPASSTGQPPRFSNSANSSQASPTAAPSSTLGPTAASSQAGTLNEAMSTASIKSGVIGFPQGQSSHAALDRTRHQDATQNDRTSKQDPTGPSTVAGDAALKADETGVEDAAHPIRQLHHQKDHENLRASSTQQPSEQAFQKSDVTTDTDRAFPLAGGVTSRKQAVDPSPARSAQPHAPVAGERELGTKDRDAYADNSHDKEKFVGAAALATAAGAHGATKRSAREQELERDQKRDDRLSGLSGSVAPSRTSDVELLRPEHEVRSGHSHGDTLGTSKVAGGFVDSSSTPQTASEQDQGTTHDKAALAAATAAAAMHSSGSTLGHEHGGHGHTFSGDPCETSNEPSSNVFTSGPHATDTANRLDPHLHIPGEFPETPMETPLDQTTGTGEYIGSRRQGLGVDAVEHSGERSHHGRDATLAAGVGAYAASKHHREPTDIGSAPVLPEASPYSSTKLDPRVNPQSTQFTQSTSLGEQRIDPTARKEPSRGNGQTLSSQQEKVPSAQAQENTPSVQAQENSPSAHAQEQNPEHHYARDAGVVGAGAGIVGAGAAAHHHSASRDHQELRTGPASSTIGPHSSNLANVLDPGVQPDPALQKHHEARSTDEDPASKTVGPHDSNVLNVLDPRVLPQPEKQKGHTTSGPHQSDMLNRLDPKVDSSPHRGAAAAGGTGAADLGAYEAARAYDEHRNTGPSASMNNQRYDTTAAGAHDPYQAGKHHYGRDVALAGGVGAAGVGAYAASKHGGDAPQQPVASQGYSHPSATQGYSQSAAPQGYSHPNSPQGYPQSAAPQGHPATSAFGQPQGQHRAQEPGHQRYDSVQHSDGQQHNKRNTAALGAAGVVGAGGAYAYSQHEAEKAEKQRLAQEKAQHKAAEKELEHQRKEQQRAQQKELDHQRRKQQKELDQKLKEQDKAFKLEQHKLEKQQVRDQKHHDKLVAAEETRRQKELDHERRRRSSEVDKEDGTKEKKHHLFGFLHRDKDKHSRNRSTESSPRASKEYAPAGAATAGLAAHDPALESDSSDGKRDRNRLHKDPPPGHPAGNAGAYGY